MKICGRTRTMLLIFNNKIICRKKFGKISNLVIVIVSIMQLKDRSNT